ncbi:hypothetical protein N7499_010786 [Penicillium canescens]|uniref:Protamine P1 n=1 Tax=Penicillium canescens TaxID=5083 RepID=A0AAD6IKS7_PENCN|nr:uncharacterized protein N7446_006053 [Penicillium canescens]KAJ5990258.1 hypothetical protein N7522_010465 [Penicillium canescens]KAJ6051421.1 hypothetical protein N7460_001955 [Penicillium canescens]KAJ6061933.1 hypothetical protein N7446_006053 [Penicillium canescens]KAJ6065184.1 hypothetical protein N7444_000837 [Penicillium canescens]KAJ6068899.1 hypothetical protein N7499_010786 [Penicillium canescens]
MPYPRPVSPVSLEKCPPPFDIDPDDLLGSDDELDDAGRDARRRRVEKLAESYLQGKPLFILSASLRGPLEDGWVNPWRKSRARAGSAPAPRASLSRPTCVPEKVVQETDLRTRRHSERLPSETSRPEIPATSWNSPAGSSMRVGERSSNSRSGRTHSVPIQRLQHSERSERLSRSPVKVKELPSSAANEESFAPCGTADWLKKDRKRMNFTKFDPPSSPTIPAASRQLENRARRPAPRSVQVQVPQTPAFPTKFRPVGKDTVKPAAVDSTSTCHSSLHSSRSAGSTARPVPTVSKSSPFNRKISPSKNISLDMSLRVVSSSSQLPRFEYRPWLHDKSNQHEPPKSPSDDESILQEETVLYDDTPEDIPHDMPRNSPSTSPTKKQAGMIISEAPQSEETEAHTKAPVVDKAFPKKDKTQKTSSKDLRFADEEDAGTSTYEITDHSVPTEQNTCEDLPSAQAVPAPLGISDRMTSLHSTLLPKEHSEMEMDTDIDTQLSTQAALLHAQKSFQDDLESPTYHKATPAQKRRAGSSPDGATYSANITPFYRAMSPLIPDKTRMQAMSTQFMLDAATPYTFSTEKKPRASRPDFGGTPSTKKKKTAHIADAFPSPGNGSLGPDNDYNTAQSGPAGGSQRLASQESDRPPTFRSTAPNASFPITFTGSTPPTIQDGQGAQQGAETFNLSQAIADAGSWLQQSFDFVKDTGRPSQSLTSGGPQPTLNMDISR